MQGNSVDVTTLKKTNLLSRIKEERKEKAKSSSSSSIKLKSSEKKPPEEEKEEEVDSLNNISIYTFSAKESEEVINSDNSERGSNRKTTDTGNNFVSFSGTSEDSSKYKRNVNLLHLAREAKKSSLEKKSLYNPPSLSSFSLEKKSSKKEA